LLDVLPVWAVLDLARLIAQGHGEIYIIGWKPRCRYCDGRGADIRIAWAIPRPDQVSAAAP
jgi:hypothetical protein